MGLITEDTDPSEIAQRCVPLLRTLTKIVSPSTVSNSIASSQSVWAHGRRWRTMATTPSTSRRNAVFSRSAAHLKFRSIASRSEARTQAGHVQRFRRPTDPAPRPRAERKGW